MKYNHISIVTQAQTSQNVAPGFGAIHRSPYCATTTYGDIRTLDRPKLLKMSFGFKEGEYEKGAGAVLFRQKSL